jgi:hypothetical protein
MTFPVDDPIDIDPGTDPKPVPVDVIDVDVALPFPLPTKVTELKANFAAMKDQIIEQELSTLAKRVPPPFIEPVIP